MVEHYRFGHTFAGSFGYTIESPLIHESDVFRSEFQDRLFELEAYTDEEVVVTPLERRVMERVGARAAVHGAGGDRNTAFGHSCRSTVAD